MDPERYRHLTYDVTMAAAKTLARLNPGMVFTYVTGKGTDSTEQGSLRWARVKGKTENDLLKLPFKAAYMFRPSGIQPLHGVRSKTGWINVVYAVTAPLLSWMVHAVPNQMTTSEQLGRAMIKVARDGYPKPILESEDINASSVASLSRHSGAVRRADTLMRNSHIEFALRAPGMTAHPHQIAANSPLLP